MKKLLAVLLSVIMAASLAVPAFADGPDGPPMPEDLGYSVDGEPVPIYTVGEAIPIMGILEDESIGIIGGQDGPTAIITGGPDLPDLDMTREEWDALLQNRHQQFIDQEKAALGGVPGQVGVMVNGAYIKFPDAAPELTNGRTMVPVRALVETLGGEVDYQDGTVTFTIDESAYEFVVGSTTVTVRAYDTGIDTPLGIIEMDCAPYIKGGRTYVPIRFISEALGYDVGWDGAYETAILLDREALAAEIDKNFTILNRVQAARTPAVEEGKTLRQDLKGSATVTLFDTLNGNTTYNVDLSGRTLLNSEAVSGTYSLILSDKVIDRFLEQYSDRDEDELELMRTVLKGLKDMQVIMTEEGKLWAHAPAMDEVSGEKNVWCAVDMGAEFGKAMFSGTNIATMGDAIAAMMEVNSVAGWSQMMEAAEFLNNMYGDERFTTSGGVSTCTVGLEELAELAGIDVDEAKEELKEFKLVMKVDSRGGATVTCTMETEAQLGMPAVKMTMDCTQNSSRANLTMTLHVANMGEGKVTLTATQQTTGEKPLSEPPADAVIVAEGVELLNP